MKMYVNGMEIPKYSGKPYHELCNNEPDFSEPPQSEKYKKTGSYKIREKEFEIYSAYTCIKGDDLSREGSRKNRQRVTKYYPDKYNFIQGKYLYNFCHLIAHQFLKNEPDKRNLVVGTRYMNETGMMHFEKEVYEYLKRNPKNHVLYRVTPAFQEGDQLIRGVQMEALSVEDKEVCFNVFVYNAQPGVKIYMNGGSEEEKKWCEKTFPNAVYAGEKEEYILNTGTHKIHKRDCNILRCNSQKDNKRSIICPIQFLKDNGYTPCECCKQGM
ncbi:MAG: DNA/RNA non-specific endonuclease [bacterium]|nr:DNA/RNA non-specific endonuclease [bacterium]